MPLRPITESEFQQNITKKKQISEISTDTQMPINNTTLTTKIDLVGKSDSETFIVTKAFSDSNYHRQNLPSKGFFYKEHKDIHYRALKVKDLTKIQLYLKHNNITHLIDAIQNCILDQIDVRDLTLDDFTFLAMQIAFSSHTKPELTVSWESFYKNTNSASISLSNFKINTLNTDALLKEVPNFKELKFFPCNVRSYEHYELNKFKEGETDCWSEEQTTLYWEFARFCQFDTPEEQIEYIENLDVASSTHKALRKFIKLCKHDVSCQFTGTDQHFDPEAALVTLKERLAIVQTLTEDVYETLIEDTRTADLLNPVKIQTEINRIESHLEASQEVGPIQEDVPFLLTIRDIIQPLLD